MDFYHIFQAFILGLVQGLSEFLPISSSGHLTLLPWLFHWDTPGLVFDTSLHIGTALALLSFFYRDFLTIGQSFFHYKDTARASERKLGYMIIIGMLPAGVIGVLLEKHIEFFFQAPLGALQVMCICTSLIFFGLLLWHADTKIKKNQGASVNSLYHALIIGCSQILALFPGTSRSGITMTTGMALGYTREHAARFSFLVGAPITLAAGIFKLKDLQHTIFTPEIILYFLVGFFTSALSGYLCIRFFLSYLRRFPVTFFTIYRICFATIILCILLFR